MISVGLVTLGCPKNQVDSEIMLGLLDQAKFNIVDNLEEADVVIVNTCGFIESAKQESIDTILELSQLKDSGRLKYLVVTGCLAQRYYDELKKEIPEIDTILGTGNFDRIVEVIEEGLKGQDLGGIIRPKFEYRKDLPRIITTPGYTAYVKIAEGCNNRCSYCIIPTLRGPLKSRSIEDILEEVKELVSRGVKEIILVAQDTTVYGIERYGQPMLAALLRKLVEIDGIHWIRIMYSYPDYLTDEVIEIIAQEEKICKYLDLPIQHASDRILKLMNRPTRQKEVEALIKKIRERIPDVVLRTSLIVGFPGETEEDFQQLVDFVRRIRFDRLGVFTYSREENTPADRMKGHLPEEIKKERWNKIMAIQREIALEKNEVMIDKEVEVLVEEVYSEEEGIVIGRTQWDAPEIDNLVYVYNCHAQVGDFIMAKIVDALEYDLVGEEIK
ncbi:ribosomal protein S12 methylthiotransferase RimO [Anoxybacter fermentans]|uniref:Ribosomal protein uS12 methylthiotransferase RimO n=1 Tax=Anoxybacter fermentans TaxID=1323375 RepID=A0A3S9SW89_9FIRM|nr:30S ribosomal protein S12 methylthiotransferase RimO [Anoxybacter fermentans]AZR72551.1 ribosomal protein S12 methylthiotransferase RimO [Anoxybacter fermentans]